MPSHEFKSSNLPNYAGGEMRSSGPRRFEQAPPPDINTLLNSLGEAIEAGLNLACHLRGKLEPVLTPQPPAIAAMLTESFSEPCCQIGEKIKSLTSIAKGVAVELRDIQDRLAV